MSDEEIRARTMQVATAYQTLLGKWDEWIELWADDGELEFPFAPPAARASTAAKRKSSPT